MRYATSRYTMQYPSRHCFNTSRNRSLGLNLKRVMSRGGNVVLCDGVTGMDL